MDKTRLLSTSTIIRSLDAKKDSFCPKVNDEEILDS